MKARMIRREFFRRAVAATAVAQVGLGNALAAPAAAKRMFLAGFSHETNTFHPVPTGSFSYAKAGDLRLAVWKDSGLVVVPGMSAYPAGGGSPGATDLGSAAAIRL